MEEMTDRISILGVPVDIINGENLDEKIETIIRGNQPEQIRFLSFSDFMRAKFSKESRALIESCALIVPTSSRLVKAAQFLYKRPAMAFAPFPFIIRLLGFIEKKGGSVYLLGGKKKETIISESNLKTSFPGISFIGRYTAHFHKNMESNIITAIKKASPSLLLAGTGLKGKDKWIYRNKQKFNPGLNIFEEECFKIFSGKKESSENPGVVALKKSLSFIIKPWNLLKIFFILWFFIALPLYRLKLKR